MSNNSYSQDFLNWRQAEEMLQDCPFCGGRPRVTPIGNEHSARRVVIIKCKKCRVERRDASLKFGFDFLWNAARDNWNQRPMEQ